jgi:hypothetical protein
MQGWQVTTTAFIRTEQFVDHERALYLSVIVVAMLAGNAADRTDEWACRQ